MSEDYPDIQLADFVGEECQHVKNVPTFPLGGPWLLRPIRNSPLKFRPMMSSQKAEILKLMTKNDLHICKDEKANFARPNAPLRAIVSAGCAAKIRVRCKITVVESPAFIPVLPGEHEWTALDEVYTWDMEEQDTYTFPVGGILSTGFGTLSGVRLDHEGDYVYARGTWTGPRSGVKYDEVFPRPCFGVINSTEESPYQFFLGFSPQISDATFQESNPPDPGRPPSDNFNALPWKDFWHYKTWSPKASYPIGVYGVNVNIYSYGKVND